MPITPGALRVVRKACSFQYGDDTVNLHYYPAGLGGDAVATLNTFDAKIKAAEDEAAAEAITLELGAWLGSIIAWWDYLEDDGETMQPLTPANLARQIMQFGDFMRAVLVAIIEDYKQGNAQGTLSSANYGASSSPTAASASMRASRNTSASSSSHAGSKGRHRSNG